MYLDDEKEGVELATNGEVGVLILVTDGDLVAVDVGVVDGVDANLIERSMTVLFVFGELKSNDNRDLFYDDTQQI